jgi:hypothetical protein
LYGESVYYETYMLDQVGNSENESE